MTYQLGIDLGTTYTAAAICRANERSPGGADVVTLGARSATVASVMYLADDGSVLVGEAAERRALTDPDRVVREFKRRIGDEIPLMIGGRPFQAHELGARMIRWVVDLVSEREGGPPRRIAVTHPASWGAHKKDLLGRALRDVGLTVTFLAEPQAAAVSYASAERVDAGSTVAVYDLGGGTFDAAVVRKNNNGTFELLGQPEGIERLGGVDFDEVVFSHVRDSLGGQLDSLDPEDPNVLSAVARLRRECVEAKEALSSDTEATIPVLLPELRTQTRLVRSEFEAMIRPALEETIVALRRAVSSAGLRPDDLSAVLLVGGSSRIPLVSQLVSDELGRPVAVDADPKTAIAMGAALAISPQPAARPAPAAAPPPMQQLRQQAPGPSAAAAAAGASAGAAYLARSGGPGLGGGPGGHSGPPPGPPPRPMGAEPPPRPDAGIEPAGFVKPPRGRGGQDDGYYAEPAKRKQTGLLIGIGGILAIAAILAAVFLWPTSGDANSTGNSTDLTPSTTVPSTPTERSSSGGGSNTHVNKPTPKPPTRTTVNQTTTRTAPPSTPASPSTKPSEPKPPPSSSNNGGTGNSGDNNGSGNPGGDQGTGNPQSQQPDNSTATPNGGTGGSAAASSTNGTNSGNPFGSQSTPPGNQSGTGQVGTNPNNTRQINPQVTASNAPPDAGTQPRNAESDPSAGAEGSSVQQPWAQSGGVARAVAQPDTAVTPAASPAVDGPAGTS
jgi:actin-like ATPase involved in cell morphogenesis